MASGLTPLYHLNGLPIKARMYKKEASIIIGVGDLVVKTGSAEADTFIPLVDRFAISGLATGVVTAIVPLSGDLSKRHLAAADSGYVMVVDDPDVMFSIEQDGDGGNIAVTAVGEFVDLATIANANTTTGVSTMVLDSSNAGTGDNLKIHGLVRDPKNLDATTPRVLVTINEHTERAVTVPV